MEAALRRKERLLLGAVAIGQCVLPSAASAETIFSADVSAGVGVATNPYLLTGPNTDSGSASISVSPRVLVKEAASTFELSGTIQHVEYFKRYDSTQNYSADANYDRKLSGQTRMRANFGFDSSVTSANDIFVDPIGGVIDPTLPPIIGDVTLNGTRQRRNSFRGFGGIYHSISPRSQINLEFNGALLRLPNGGVGLDEFDTYGENLSYSRRVNERLSLGASVGVSRSNYLRTRVGDATVISPQLTLDLQIDARWSLNAAAGASINRINEFLGRSTTTTLSGSFGVCRRGDRSNFCLDLSRSAAPSSLNGLRTQTSIGASYSYRLSERTDLSASANYSRASRPLVNVGSAPIEYFNSSLTLSRQLNQRLHGFVSAGYGDSFQQGFQQRANIQGNVGVRYRLGDRR